MDKFKGELGYFTLFGIPVGVQRNTGFYNFEKEVGGSILKGIASADLNLFNGGIGLRKEESCEDGSNSVEYKFGADVSVAEGKFEAGVKSIGIDIGGTNIEVGFNIGLGGNIGAGYGTDENGDIESISISADMAILIGLEIDLEIEFPKPVKWMVNKVISCFK